MGGRKLHVKPYGNTRVALNFNLIIKKLLRNYGYSENYGYHNDVSIEDANKDIFLSPQRRHMYANIIETS